MSRTACLVLNVSSVSGLCKKYWQLKLAHLLTWPISLVSLPAMFVPATCTLAQVDFFQTSLS